MTTDSPGSSILRILIFNWRDLAHPLAGGAEVYTHRVAEEWIKMGHEVTLFCTSVDGRPEIEDLNGLKIIRRGGKHSVYREARKYYKNEGRGNFDLVIDEVNTRPFGAPKWASDTQVIALIHQVCREIWFYEVPFLFAIIGRYMLEPIWLRAYRDIQVITISQSSKESLGLYGLQNIEIVPAGFDFEPLELILEKESNPTIIYVGRLARNKRPDHVIKMFKIIKDRIPNATLWVVGSGPMDSALRGNAPSGVKFFGRVSETDKKNLIAKANALVVTSVREGWGLVVTEAAALGTIPVVYKVAGLVDSAAASNGLVSDPNPVSLSSVLIDLINGEFEEIKVAPLGVDSWSNVASRILNVWNEKIDEKTCVE